MTRPRNDRQVDTSESASEKRDWEAPTLSVLGSVGAVTARGSSNLPDASTSLISGV